MEFTTENLRSRLELTSGMLYASVGLCCWASGSDLQLINTNCPDRDFFSGLLQTDPTASNIREHFSKETMPMICTDRIGIGWATILHEGIYYSLGPYLTLDATETYIRRACHEAGIPQEMTRAFLKHIDSMPIIHFQSINQYVIMLYYALTGETLSPDSIRVRYTENILPHKEVWNDLDWHGTWSLERVMIQAIRSGDEEAYKTAVRKMGALRVGDIGNGDALRNAKNLGITFVTIISRSAMEAGMSPEGSYRLSDQSIQRIESCRFASDVFQIIEEITSVYFDRIRLVQKNRNLSSGIRSVIDYIETHIREKISLEYLADETGYTAYYLSRKFQKETGKSISDYIRERKVEYAKNRLLDGHVSLSDLSEELAFSSPSYFSAVFRKVTGHSPTEYLKE